MSEHQSQLLSLKQLSKGRNEKKIKIRVVRLWNTYNPRKNDELMSMDFIGLDEKKDAMHFMIRSKFVPDFNGLIVEGNFYFMKNFRVDGCKEKYRLLDQDTFILFDATTCVEEIIMNLPTIPRYYFSLVPYDKLESVGDNHIIGVVVGVSCFGDRMAAGSNIKMCKLDLMDTRENRLRLTIWNQQAKLLSEFSGLSDMGNKILIVTSTIISKDGGQIVASSSSATQFYSDLDSPDVHEFRATLQGKELDHVVKEIQLFSSSVSRPEYEKHKKKIEDIQTALDGGEDLPNQLYVHATIMQINEKNGWKYNSCANANCKKKLQIDDGKLYCKKCNLTAEFPTIRYRVEVQLQDSTGSLPCVLFDREVEKLIHVKASELAHAMIEDEMEDPIPQLLRRILGKCFVFQLKFNEYSRGKSKEDFTVDQIFFDTDIIDEKSETETSSSALKTPSGLEKKRTIDNSSSTHNAIEIFVAEDGSEKHDNFISLVF